MTDVRSLLHRHLPHQRVTSVRPLGEGGDHAAYDVDGRLVVRLSKDGDPSRRADEVRREAALLDAVRDLSPLPTPRVVLADPDEGALAYELLPGVSLLDRPVADPASLAEPLGRLLTSLHGAPVEQMSQLVARDTAPPAAWLEDAAASYDEIPAGQLAPGARRRIEEFLGSTAPAPATTACFCHNDLGAEHLLADPATDRLTGVIDWSDAAVADPAVDLGRLYRDLGPDVVDRVLAAYAGPVGAGDLARVRFYARCTLVEDLAFAAGSGDDRYRDAALAHLDRTFA